MRGESTFFEGYSKIFLVPSRRKMARLPSEIMSELRCSFESGKTKSLSFRIKQLKNLQKLYEENQDQITDALWSDLRKNKGEAILTEVGVLINDVKCMLYNIHSWSKREYVERDLANVLDTAYIQREPYGVVLVIGMSKVVDMFAQIQ